jgi:hypothetical protein
MKPFAEFITEKILSIGINPEHEQHREKYRDQIHQVLQTSYSKVPGGYSGLGSGSKEESNTIHQDISNSMIKMTLRSGKVSAVRLYKKQYGKKSIAGGTDGTHQGKKDFMKTTLEDHEQKRAWGEASGAPEAIARKMGVPVIPNKHAEKLTGKSVTIEPGETEYYYRKLGDSIHKKVMLGHPKLSD